ncbi:hypothetical protein D3C71_1571070 [compost metagenome]
MGCGSNASMSIRDLVTVLLDVGDEFLKRRRRELIARDDRHRGVADEPDRFKRLHGFIGQLPVKCWGRRHSDMVYEDRIAVRICVGHTPGTNRTACACDVLHDDLLAERL